MHALRFRTALMVVGVDRIVSVFSDAHVNVMHLPSVDTPGQRAIARAHGYGGNWQRFTVEHDAAHHFLADARGEPWSAALHDGDGTVPLHLAPQHMRDEEHLVNRFLARLRLGEPDPYGALERVFAGRLAALGAVFAAMVAAHAHSPPRHLATLT